MGISIMEKEIAQTITDLAIQLWEAKAKAEEMGLKVDIVIPSEYHIDQIPKVNIYKRITL
jgi:hypothetical protein